MENEPRKASDILLDLESKVDTLLQMLQSQNFIINLLSNKLNTTIELLNDKKDVLSIAPSLPKFKVESGIPPINNDILISTENNLSLDTSPNGFRRTSRPETYANNAGLVQPFISPPVKNEVLVPKINQSISTPIIDSIDVSQPKLIGGPNAVSVSQRIVDRNGKSVFLADVEIVDLSTNNSIFKTRTNGAGKWLASLSPGEYRVFVRKREALTKEKVEIIQEISVDGIKSALDLKMMIIK